MRLFSIRLGFSLVIFKSEKGLIKSYVGLIVDTSKDLEAIANTWYNFPIDGANASERIGSLHIVDFSIRE